MATDLRSTCPIEGCDYTTGFVLSGEITVDPDEQAEKVERLRAEHPAHPPSALTTTEGEAPRSASERAIDQAIKDYAYDHEALADEPNF